MNPAILGAVFLILTAILAVVLNALPIDQANMKWVPAAPVTAPPKSRITPAVPSEEPKTEPDITSIRLFAYGSDRTDEGFTAYVGDKPITLSVELEPAIDQPPVSWSISNSVAAELTVSDDKMSCKFTPLKASGKIELVVSCYDKEAVFPVYVWDR
ncbi:MAG: hypothetical protein K6C08_00745 [Oscillospiraceae bacterium]|nr:hypothetical protein [Oscillospiraceae bacterium]